MRILRGGSAEGADKRWVKFDVELDESDILAEVVKHDLNQEALTVIQKYTLLVNLAELLVTVRMEALGVMGEQASAELSKKYKDYVSTLPKAE